VLVLALAVPITSYDATDPDADHFEMAIDLAEDGNVDGALVSFRACARFSPSPEAHSNLGMALLEPELTSMSQPDAEAAAVLAFEKALELNPKHRQSKEQLKLLRPPLISPRKFMQGLLAHLGESPLDFSGEQLAAIEQFGAAYKEGATGDTAPPWLVATDEYDDEDEDSNPHLEQAVSTFNFAKASQLCHSGQLGGSETIYNVPILNWLGLYVQRFDQQLDPLAICLIEKGSVTDAHGGPTSRGATSKYHPLLLSAVAQRNPAITSALVASNASLLVSFRLGKKGGSTPPADAPLSASLSGMTPLHY
jgi:hypothetical protein